MVKINMQVITIQDHTGTAYCGLAHMIFQGLLVPDCTGINEQHLLMQNLQEAGPRL